MNASLNEIRRQVIKRALVNNALSGFKPSDFGLGVFEQWIHGHWTTDEAVALVIQHYQQSPTSDSDNAAPENNMGLTDSRQLRVAEADITTLRMAQLEIDYYRP